MYQVVKKPYKINIALYTVILLVSIIMLVIGVFVGQENNYSIFAEILKGISIGCLSSGLIALFIDIRDVKDKNKKYNDLFQAVYIDLQFSISKYIEEWSVFCLFADKENDYSNEKLTWTKWYNITKSIIYSVDKKRKEELLKILKNRLHIIVDIVNEKISFIKKQKYLLEINDIYDYRIDKIINNLEFEFSCIKTELDFDRNVDDFFHYFDSLNEDIEDYINQWEDIDFFNNLKFNPHNIVWEIKCYLLSKGIS